MSFHSLFVLRFFNSELVKQNVIQQREKKTARTTTEK